ncbi:MAG: hypothetical protein KAU29_09345, partial [Gammaproteobacteria bacterium]|nr:hypothetical protein [Gammaproteobacteria bacterium]
MLFSACGGVSGDAEPAFYTNPDNPPTTTPPPLNIAPTISGSPEVTLVENVFYSFTPNVNDADGDNLTFSITNLPSWANFQNNTGTLSGTPSSVNIGTTSGIVITVSDGIDSVSLPAFSITVVNAADTPPTNTPPTISGIPATTVTESVAYSFTPNVNDADGDNLNFSITNLPS